MGITLQTITIGLCFISFQVLMIKQDSLKFLLGFVKFMLTSLKSTFCLLGFIEYAVKKSGKPSFFNENNRGVYEKDNHNINDRWCISFFPVSFGPGLL
jgi:hypothetical protein